MNFRLPLLGSWLAQLLLASMWAPQVWSQPVSVSSNLGQLPTVKTQTLPADFIVAVVNSEPITNNEVRIRMAQVEQQIRSQNAPLPARSELMEQTLQRLINERAQLHLAQENGIKIDEFAINDAEAAVAGQNRMSLTELRRRIVDSGLTVEQFRAELRDQITLTRLREREVESRVKVSDFELDQFINEQKAQIKPSDRFINMAQILVEVPEQATAEQVGALQARALRALQRAKAGEDFAALALTFSDSPNKQVGGEMGLKTVDRHPELFVKAVEKLKVGEVADQLVRSGAGFHVIKLLESKQAPDGLSTIVQYRSRHILLRVDSASAEQQALAQLEDFRRQIVSRRADFASLARQYSQDASAAEGGDLGWVGTGQFVPEFEEVLTALAPGEIAKPLVSRFGVHLVQLLEQRNITLGQREQRDRVKPVLREKKLVEATENWVQEVRGKAYVELRDPPQ